MKKIWIIILLLISSILFTWCNSENITISETNLNLTENQTSSENNSEENSSNSENILQTNNNTMNENKSLVLYFSPTWNTKRIANFISEINESEIVEILPEIPYTSDDLDYNSDCRANKEQNDPNARPQISTEISIDWYDTIYLWYPIWWWTNPKIILTLIENFDFSWKEIVLFCTSWSSWIWESETELKWKWLNIIWAKRFSASSSKEEVQNWLESL